MLALSDVDVQTLATIGGALQRGYAADQAMWVGSPFAWIKSCPSRQIGAIGERLIAGWLATKHFNVVRSPDSEADLLVEGRRVEVKFSTLWQSGIYKFQQLRDQNYEFAICLGVSPLNAHCWAIPKSVIMERWRSRDGIYSQHGGAAGNDTAWLSINPITPFAWVQDFGGSLARGAEVIGRLSGQSL